jgi:hypothetical protein
VDTQPFPINTIDIACKDIIIGKPRMSNISQKKIARKAPDDKAKKSGGTGGRHN